MTGKSNSTIEFTRNRVGYPLFHLPLADQFPVVVENINQINSIRHHQSAGDFFSNQTVSIRTVMPSFSKWK